MPWPRTCVMDNRTMFFGAYLRDEEPISRLCGRYGISRKTGYKWLDRYEADGALGLRDHSRARHTQTLSIDAATASEILALREKRESWGPRKLLGRLALTNPGGVGRPPARWAICYAGKANRGPGRGCPGSPARFVHKSILPHRMNRGPPTSKGGSGQGTAFVASPLRSPTVILAIY